MTAQESAAEVATVESRHRRAARRHRILVHLTQVGVLLVIVGGWQLVVQGDPRSVILYGVPSGIVMSQSAISTSPRESLPVASATSAAVSTK